MKNLKSSLVSNLTSILFAGFFSCCLFVFFLRDFLLRFSFWDSSLFEIGKLNFHSAAAAKLPTANEFAIDVGFIRWYVLDGEYCVHDRLH